MPCSSEGNYGPSESEIVRKHFDEMSLSLPYLEDSSYSFDLDKATATLCATLSAMPKEQLQNQSLELQMWWRDHQRRDAEREARDRAELNRKALAASAREKLTPEELKALGVK